MLEDKMANFEEVQGMFVSLRPISESDAEITLNMRLNNKKNIFLHKIENNISNQREFIRKQIESDEYLFIIENKEKKVVGMRGLYNFIGKTAEVGRTLFIGSPVETIEAYCLIYDFAFEKLGLDSVSMTALEFNSNSRGMQTKFGAKKIKSEYNEEFACNMDYSVLSKEDYYANREIIYSKVKNYYRKHMRK